MPRAPALPTSRREVVAAPFFDVHMEGDRFHDHCGVVGIVSRERDVAPFIYYALRALQHRGQESAGVSTFDGTSTTTHRAMGLVEQVFDDKSISRLAGRTGIGHVRYATTGGSVAENAQPVVVVSAAGDLALAHNGDIVNSGKLRDELKSKGWAFTTTNDTEVALRMLADEIVKGDSPVRAIRKVLGRLIGSYCFVLLANDRVYAIRDPLGIKPLCYGTLADGSGTIVASESTALNVVDAKLVRDVEPGEILEIGPDGVKSHRAERADDAAHCMFEYVYFARADSVMDAKSVHQVRTRIGRRLAKEAPADADVVVPVPDSGRTHALGYAAASGIPFSEGLMKNRYVHRTFIMPEQSQRDLGVRMKLNPVRAVVEGQRVVLVDDSIVRGTTMRRIVAMLRDAGAREVHVRIGSPPITSPCYLGIDMNTRKQLVASEHTTEEIAKIIGADSLAYLSLEGLVESIGLPSNELCFGCLTGVYPVEVPGERHRLQQRLF